MGLSRKTAQLVDANGNVLASKLVNAPSFVSGTLMLFLQTAAPTGWTKVTTHNDKALRIVSGTASSGGTGAFSSIFASRTPSGTLSSTTATNQVTTATGTVGSTTLSTSQIPGHNHIQAYGNDGGVTGRYGNLETGDSRRLDYIGSVNNGTQSAYTSSTGSGGSHNHSLAMDAHSHTQDAHSHTFTGSALDFSVQYVDAIIASKD